MTGSKILVVDDDPDLLRLIQLQLEEFGYRVTLCVNGRDALTLVDTESPDLIVLDVNLPLLDGLSVCRALRPKSQVPILMLSSYQEPYEKVVGLEVGADDYLGKPYDPRELLARVRALLRRSSLKEGSESRSATALRVGTIELNRQSHEAWDDGEKLALTPIEFSLLEAFLDNVNGALSRAKLLEMIWGPGFVGSERTLDTHVRNLRGKLVSDSPRIESVRGIGFKLVP